MPSASTFLCASCSNAASIGLSGLGQGGSGIFAARRVGQLPPSHVLLPGVGLCSFPGIALRHNATLPPSAREDLPSPTS